MQVNFSTHLPEFDAHSMQESCIKTGKNNSEPKREPIEEKTVGRQDAELLKTVLAEHNISMKFGRDEDTEQIVIKMIDSKTGEIVRQMPSEVSLALGKVFDKIQGRFIDERI